MGSVRDGRGSDQGTQNGVEGNWMYVRCRLELETSDLGMSVSGE